MFTEPQMLCAFTKKYVGFTLNVLHDSANCIRCMQFYTFYNKLKSEEHCQENKFVNINSKYKLFGLVTYLENCRLHLEVVTSESLKNEIPTPRAKAEVNIQNVPCKKKNLSNQQNNVNKKSPKRIYVKKKSLKTTEKQSTKKTSGKNSLPFHAHKSAAKKTVQSRSIYKQPRVVQSKALSGKTDRSQKNIKKSKDAKQLKRTKSPSKKSNSDKKLPGKGTLKRKRWFLDKLKTAEGYEDDIFEQQKCFNTEPTVDDEGSDTLDLIDTIPTPTCYISLSPRAESEPPSYEDCYNPTELKVIRKDAEEYQYRRHKRRKSMMMGMHMNNDSVTSQKSIKKEHQDTKQVLEAVSHFLATKPKSEKDSESEADSYFSDASCDQFQKIYTDT